MKGFADGMDDFTDGRTHIKVEADARDDASVLARVPERRGLDGLWWR